MRLGTFLFFIVSSISTILSKQDVQGQIINTIAGNGTYGYSGNGGPAVLAQLGWQGGVISDKAGNVYIADFDNNVIRKVDPAGIITIFAGTGVLGFSGDGGLAINARLYHPSWMALDSSGNIYFTDQNSDIVRKVDNAGIITSVTSNLPEGYSGDGGPLSEARFNGISGIAFDNIGNMYLSDAISDVVRMVNPAGIITTIAGTGTGGFSGDGGPAVSAQLNGPYAVTFDNAGNIYIPDATNRRIRKISTTGIITTIAGTGVSGKTGDGGPALAATFSFPWSIDFDSNNNLYIGDGLNVVVRMINPAGIINSYAGNGTYGNTGDGGPALAATLGSVHTVYVDFSDDLLLSVRDNFYVIRKITNCPTALVTQQPAPVNLCNSGNASFRVEALNTSGYRWQFNNGSGWTDLTDNTIYNGSVTNQLTVTGATTAMHNYQFRCALTNGCGTLYTIPVLLSVTANSNPTINVTSSLGEICTGTSVTFNATIQNGGLAPVYLWTKNGNPVGTNMPTYHDSTLNNGDIIWCNLTSNATCQSPNTATSNTIIQTVTATRIPSISIASSDNNICPGTVVSFQATSTNGGPNPLFTWFKNGVALSINGPTYSDSTLQNGDIISCDLRSSAACANTQPVSSTPITMNVISIQVPTISITASVVTTCRNQPVTFRALTLNAGNTPLYQWKKNGINVGSGSSDYTDSGLISTDVITCTLLSGSACQGITSVSSNELSVQIHQDPAVFLNQDNTLCAGTTRTLDAGNFSAYQWNTGETDRSIRVSQTGNYRVTVTDNFGCRGSSAVLINQILPAPVNFLQGDTTICEYGSVNIKSLRNFRDYLWNTGATSNSILVTRPGIYVLTVTEMGNGCQGKDTINVTIRNCLKGFFMPNAFTPNNDGLNDLIRPLLYGKVISYHFMIFNRFGEPVFQSKDYTKGWDGNLKGINQNSETFVWTCQYQFEGEEKQKKSGTIMLVR